MNAELGFRSPHSAFRIPEAVRVTIAPLAFILISAQAPLARQTPAAPAISQSPSTSSAALVFASEAGLLFSPIKPDRTAVFEEVIRKVHDALAASPDPVRKQQAAGWKVYRAEEAYQKTTLYVSVIDPAVKGADYAVFRVLQESVGEAPARELFEKFRDAHAGGQYLLNVSRLKSGS